jgi:copper homeostasis protein
MRKLEICVDSLESAIKAQRAGADRIELCMALSEGGITPSYGLIKQCLENLDIKVNVIIRPRGGDFLYNGTEFDTMKQDIVFCREIGVNAVVSGVLNPDGSVDVSRTRELVDLARPMSFTFHRAFDVCADYEQALEAIISCNADRILSSGGESTAEAGMDLLKKLIRQAADRIIIMPGSGINPDNLEKIISYTGAKEVHASASVLIESSMQYRTEKICMNSYGASDYVRKQSDEAKIRQLKEILNRMDRGE